MKTTATGKLGYRIDASNNKDGQAEIINGNLSGQHYRIFVDSMKKAAFEIGKTIYLAAPTDYGASRAYLATVQISAKVTVPPRSVTFMVIDKK
jgi:hypothetical protein